ncbi:AMP-activated serine/threonine-protein kinase regulatory subunit [Polyrhizophydium stewartii]|uniref:AMP-activated serine/threonine-protein kinase regulatory subunit n=1 Tax=Polyrhizophydium stewartii TaxID=2732419 RepID=A0ABR4MWI7_9FUNG
MAERPSEALKRHTCYDLLPVSLKVIVFDTSLLLKKALTALIQHGVQSAPLWDSETQRFAGMLTVTDFIQLILHYYRRSSLEEALEELDQLQISGLRAIENSIGCLPKQNVTIHPLDSLYHAGHLLIDSHLHRLPLIDHSEAADTIVSVITQNKILRFIAANVPHFPELDCTLGELGIGSFGRLETASPDTPLIDVLKKLISRRLSSLPIVDEEGRVLNVYEKYDVLMLAKDGPYYNLDMPVKEALLRRTPDFEGIHSCTTQDTLGRVLETIRTTTVHRFIVLRDDRLHGIISLRDILRYLISLN